MSGISAKYLGSLMNCLHKSAIILQENGLYTQAIEAYLLLSEDDPSFDAGGYAYKLGICFRSLGELEKAKEWFEIAVREGPFMPEYQEELTRIKRQIGHA